MKTWQTVFALLAFTVAGAACGSAPAMPSPTAPHPAAAATPTRSPSPTPSPSPAPVPLGQPYTHPAGLFTARPPQGWVLSDEEDAWASFVPAEGDDGRAFFTVTALNTGQPLDAAALQQLAAGYLQMYPAAGHTLEEKAADHRFYAHRQWTDDAGAVDYRLLVQQKGAAALFVELGVPAEKVGQAAAWWEALVQAATPDAQAIGRQPPYNAFRAFSCPNDACAMDVPVGWYFSARQQRGALAYRVASPDGHAFVESVVYPFPTALAAPQARRTALQLLRAFDADDLEALPAAQATGGGPPPVPGNDADAAESHRLKWWSLHLSLYGKATYHVHQGTTLVILNLGGTETAWKTLGNVWEHVEGTYETPWWEENP